MIQTKNSDPDFIAAFPREAIPEQGRFFIFQGETHVQFQRKGNREDREQKRAFCLQDGRQGEAGHAGSHHLLQRAEILRRQLRRADGDGIRRHRERTRVRGEAGRLRPHRLQHAQRVARPVRHSGERRQGRRLRSRRHRQVLRARRRHHRDNGMLPLDVRQAGSEQPPTRIEGRARSRSRPCHRQVPRFRKCRQDGGRHQDVPSQAKRRLQAVHRGDAARTDELGDGAFREGQHQGGMGKPHSAAQDRLHGGAAKPPQHGERRPIKPRRNPRYDRRPGSREEVATAAVPFPYRIQADEKRA